MITLQDKWECPKCGHFVATRIFRKETHIFGERWIVCVNCGSIIDDLKDGQWESKSEFKDLL